MVYLFRHKGDPMIKVTIGSSNLVKVNAVKFAFESNWPEEDFEFSEIEVSSGVSEQPMSDLETRLGAKNRALSVLAQTDADYGFV